MQRPFFCFRLKCKPSLEHHNRTKKRDACDCEKEYHCDSCTLPVLLWLNPFAKPPFLGCSRETKSAASVLVFYSKAFCWMFISPIHDPQQTKFTTRYNTWSFTCTAHYTHHPGTGGSSNVGVVIKTIEIMWNFPYFSAECRSAGIVLQPWCVLHKWRAHPMCATKLFFSHFRFPISTHSVRPFVQRH